MQHGRRGDTIGNMPRETAPLEKVQQLVLDLAKVRRNHRIPGDERRENVIEHSFAIAVLSWKIFEMVRPPLSLEKVLKYAMIHDAAERGMEYDVNTYAGPAERKAKEERESKELESLNREFADFPEFASTLNDYERREDGEALFVWSVDKLQAKILGGMDDWRPYRLYGVSYDEFCRKGEEQIEKCSPYLKEIFRGVFEESKKTYYDRPKD